MGFRGTLGFFRVLSVLFTFCVAVLGVWLILGFWVVFGFWCWVAWLGGVTTLEVWFDGLEFRVLNVSRV